ncbi:MAG: glycosyltransferase family 1 protein [Paracoccaceae bacterium]
MVAIVLDISRSISRVAQSQLTGIDRVELAYIKHFLDWPGSVFFLARIGGYSALLERRAMRELFSLIQNHGPWEKPGFWQRWKRQSEIEKITATLRKLAISGLPLKRGLQRHVPAGFTYINVGHGALKPAFWPKLRAGGVGEILLMVHDVIPLNFPQFCRPETTENFTKKLRAALKHSDIIIYNSHDTAKTTQVWLDKWGIPTPETHVVYLGTDPLPAPAPAPKTARHPYFVTLGTIEPRKNHRLLLDIWADFHATLPLPEIPHLYIIGARGWQNEDVFATLDSADFMGKTLHECGRIPDVEAGTLLAGAQALLFPSFAEGFGYPLIEAMQMNIPVICSNLPSFFETAGDSPTYIDPANMSAWREKILNATTVNGKMPDINAKIPVFPTWDAHFHKVATILTIHEQVSI